MRVHEAVQDLRNRRYFVIIGKSVELISRCEKNTLNLNYSEKGPLQYDGHGIRENLKENGKPL